MHYCAGLILFELCYVDTLKILRLLKNQNSLVHFSLNLSDSRKRLCFCVHLLLYDSQGTRIVKAVQ